MTLTGAVELARRFGDPWDEHNPVGHAAVLAADERGEMLAAGEDLLDDYGLGAEFVPRDLGGRLGGLDDLLDVTRTVFRHDPALGLGYGASSFIASVNVWTAGNPDQRRQVADLLLANRKVASAYHELAHGNDVTHAECAATPGGPRELVLNGRKEVVTNVQRADALVLFARTAGNAGARAHSQLLVDKSAIPRDGYTYLPRFPSSGMRGVQLGGIEFRDCPVSEDAVLGFAGQGTETALRSFQITRTLLPAMAAGCLDTGLRTTLRFGHDRVLYGRRVTAMPLVRAILADAFVDLLTADCFARVAARALHLLPGETSVYASAAKYFVSRHVMDAMDRLSKVLGAHFYLRDGTYGIFQKLLRDLAPAGFGHAARAACLATILPQLPMLARRTSRECRQAPADLFRLNTELPPVPFDQLAINATGDGLGTSLLTTLDTPIPPPLRALAEVFARELRELRGRCAELPPSDLGILASPDVLALAARHTVLLAASACLNVWRHNTDHEFLGDPTWVTAALHRLAEKLGVPTTEPRDDLRERMFTELVDRHENQRAFDLPAHRLT